MVLEEVCPLKFPNLRNLSLIRGLRNAAALLCVCICSLFLIRSSVGSCVVWGKQTLRLWRLRTGSLIPPPDLVRCLAAPRVTCASSLPPLRSFSFSTHQNKRIAAIVLSSRIPASSPHSSFPSPFWRYLPWVEAPADTEASLQGLIRGQGDSRLPAAALRTKTESEWGAAHFAFTRHLEKQSNTGQKFWRRHLHVDEQRRDHRSAWPGSRPEYHVPAQLSQTSFCCLN